ncbi:MAG: chromate efflux transporter [Cyclobacteriaceae bacterium]|nr:chromate efflux transporter [Cytophagales bacterium]MCZ8329102.1 chromate efflux transporter [Cyclobacteriaceae bacterium]
MVKQVRYFIFLKDVLMLSLTTFGGPQAHLGYFHKTLVDKRKYLTDAELMELNSLCQILPGPSSTQTLTAVGFKVGGPNLAYLTLLVWILPSVLFMTALAVVLNFYQDKHFTLNFTRFIQPMAVGFVSYAAYTITLKTVYTKSGVALMLGASLASYYFKTPFVFPIVLIIAGALTALKYRKQPKIEKEPIRINWSNFFLWAGVLIVAAIVGKVTGWLPVRLFENFYRNGSLIFGGGQVLIPYLHTEFVQYAPKQYLTTEEFLSGYAIAQSIPGPVFAFASYVGGLAMREYGLGGQIIGGLMSSFGIFLPGTFLIFFVIRFWDAMKRYRGIRASLEGITAASAGLVAAAAVLLFQPLDNTFLNFGLTIGTFCLLAFTKIPPPLIIVLGLILGFLL